MIVCHCNVVSHREVESAIACGARDECAVAAACGAGTRCGGCVGAVRDALARAGHDSGSAADGDRPRPRELVGGLHPLAQPA